MKPDPSFAAKIEAVRSDIGNDTPDKPDSITEGGIAQVDFERKKALSAAQRADLNHSQLFDFLCHQTARNERRIELFEKELSDTRKELSLSQSANISLAKEAGTLSERAGWRRWLDVACAIAVLAGSLLLTCASYLKPGFLGLAFCTQDMMDGMFVVGLATTTAAGVFNAWTALHK